MRPLVVVDSVKKRSQQVRLTKSMFTDHHQRASLIGANGLDAFQQIVRRVGNYRMPSA